MLFVIEKKNHYCIPVCHIFMFECVLHTVKTNHLRLLVFLNTGVQSSIYRSDSRASSREQALKKVRSLVYFWAYHVWTLRRNCKSNKKMLYFHVKLIFFWFCRMKVEKTKAFLSSSNVMWGIWSKWDLRLGRCHDCAFTETLGGTNYMN